MNERKKQKLLLFGTVIAYCLIGVEIIIMISPFALYFYSVYGPILEFFSSTPYLSWTAEFFLPHMVFTDDLLILAVSYMQVFLVIGLVLFFTAAVPLYLGRFGQKGVVQKSFYSRIRHPQYLFLAISGFGLLLYWPRFIILIMYMTMLFVYYFLARNEESRMRQEVPEIYEKYMKNTPMFLPGNPGGKIYKFLFSWIKPKWLGFFVAYCLTISLSVGLAMGLRAYTVNQMPIIKIESMALLPVFPRSSEEVINLYKKVVSSDTVRLALQEQGNANIVYILPGDFFLTALITDNDRRFSDDIVERFPEILEWHQHKFNGGLGKFSRIFNNYVRTLGTVETDYDVERFVFVRVGNDGQQQLSTSDLLGMGISRKPILIVDVDSDDHTILSVIKTSEQHKWGTMPMPSF